MAALSARAPWCGCNEMRLMRKLLRDQRGAAAVEMALVSIPLILFLFGIFEFGRLLWAREAIQSAAIAGARCMGVKQEACAPGGVYNEAETESFVRAQARGLYVSLNGAEVLLDDSATCSDIAGFSEVSINLTFQTAVPQLFGSLADGVPLSATACFPNQNAT